MSFNKIPSEILIYEIFQYLPIDSIVRLGSTNKFLDSIISDNTEIVDNINLAKSIIVSQNNIHKILDEGINEKSLDRIIPKFRYLIEIDRPQLYPLFQYVLYFSVNIKHFIEYDEIEEIESTICVLADIHYIVNKKRKELCLKDFIKAKEDEEELIKEREEEELLKQYEEEQKDNKIITGRIYDPSKQ